MMNECRTYLVYHIDKGLGVIPIVKEVDDIPLVPTREDSIYQEREVRGAERAFDQKSKG